jgi:hypothetical protein
MITRLRELAARVPADGTPVVTRARQRADDAVMSVAVALTADPTLAERRHRDLDVLAELLRRLSPFARSAKFELERRALNGAGEPAAHLGRTNPDAPEKLDAVSQRCTVIAMQVTAAIWPDWDTPARVRELSASRMPADETLARIAGELRHAVARALDLPHPDPEAVRLAALADQIIPQAKEA